MNFDHFLKFIHSNQDKIKNKKKINILISYYYEILLINRQKLKLGLINFEFNDFQTFMLTGEYLKIKFINQDTSSSDALKVENIIKKIGWQWNKLNVISLLITLFLIFSMIKFFFKNWLVSSFPFLFYRWEVYDNLINFSLNLILKTTWIKFDTDLVDIIFNFVVFFNLL